MRKSPAAWQREREREKEREKEREQWHRAIARSGGQQIGKGSKYNNPKQDLYKKVKHNFSYYVSFTTDLTMVWAK
jgi:hypothetical protein